MIGIAWPAWKPAGISVVLATLLLGSCVADASERRAPGALELAWLADLGSESLAVQPRSVHAEGAFWINVPGAALMHLVLSSIEPALLDRFPASMGSTDFEGPEEQSSVNTRERGPG